MHSNSLKESNDLGKCLRTLDLKQTLFELKRDLPPDAWTKFLEHQFLVVLYQAQDFLELYEEHPGHMQEFLQDFALAQASATLQRLLIFSTQIKCAPKAPENSP